ncbi:hypothetical protein PanWU01x14_350020 [Parasponia andersonii]|uniref:Uncharacterized protein n=1 Tax=Parasponia andersonii TaxID=3476 RepID=A0A2P5AB84_PARAD|nr:hypothetical protein PanWU01x14_350020 [Parasponia andersonii]
MALGLTSSTTSAPSPMSVALPLGHTYHTDTTNILPENPTMVTKTMMGFGFLWKKLIYILEGEI